MTSSSSSSLWLFSSLSRILVINSPSGIPAVTRQVYSSVLHHDRCTTLPGPFGFRRFVKVFLLIIPLLCSLKPMILFFPGAQRLPFGGPEAWHSRYPDILAPRILERSKCFTTNKQNFSLSVSRKSLYSVFVTGFLDNKEYRYLYDGQVLTGLPETANQYGQFSLSQ